MWRPIDLKHKISSVFHILYLLDIWGTFAHYSTPSWKTFLEMFLGKFATLCKSFATQSWVAKKFCFIVDSRQVQFGRQLILETGALNGRPKFIFLQNHCRYESFQMFLAGFTNAFARWIVGRQLLSHTFCWIFCGGDTTDSKIPINSGTMRYSLPK